MPMIADDVLHLVLKGLACHTQKLHTPGNRTLPTRIVLQLQYLSLFPCFKPVIQIAFGAKARICQTLRNPSTDQACFNPVYQA